MQYEKSCDKCGRELHTCESGWVTGRICIDEPYAYCYDCVCDNPNLLREKDCLNKKFWMGCVKRKGMFYHSASRCKDCEFNDICEDVWNSCQFGVATCCCQWCPKPCNGGCADCESEGKACHNVIICTGFSEYKPSTDNIYLMTPTTAIPVGKSEEPVPGMQVTTFYTAREIPI